MGVAEVEIPGQVRLVLGEIQEALHDAEPEVAVKGKLGKDGLNRLEQLDTYGRVIDAE